MPYTGTELKGLRVIRLHGKAHKKAGIVREASDFMDRPFQNNSGLSKDFSLKSQALARCRFSRIVSSRLPATSSYPTCLIVAVESSCVGVSGDRIRTSGNTGVPRNQSDPAGKKAPDCVGLKSRAFNNIADSDAFSRNLPLPLHSGSRCKFGVCRRGSPPVTIREPGARRHAR